MEKADSRREFSKSYPMIKLYKEDIEELNKLFLNNFTKYEIEADGYKLNDISEIATINKDIIYDFSLSAYDEDKFYRIIHLGIHKRSINLYINDIDNIIYLGLFYSIDNIINKRKRFSNIVNSKFGMYILLFICLILSYIINKFIIITDKLLIAIIIPLLLIYSLNIIDKKICNNNIFIKCYKDSPSFIKRNKDNLIVGIICTIIGGVIGGLLIYIITR